MQETKLLFKEVSRRPDCNSQSVIYGDSNIRVSVDENTLIKLFSDSLDKVANIRDVYPIMYCDYCEQIKTKYQMKPLRSLSNRKGFDVMLATILEHLQQDIPEYDREQLIDCTGLTEDLIDSFSICDDCAGKMLKSQENVRSLLTNLHIDYTPECIKYLNKFEMAMIRFVMPCLTIIRLEQVTVLKRPRTGRVDALEGRIVYLPLDVKVNVDIQPEKLVNINSFVIIVNGQPA